MRVDFYQLAEGVPADQVIGVIAGRLLEGGERAVLVSSSEADLARLDRLLWQGSAASFLPHGIAGTSDDSRQPLLLSQGVDSPTGARNLIIADGEWREAALNFERAFFLFTPDEVEAARLAWKLLAGRDGVERNYWANEDGRWTRKG